VDSCDGGMRRPKRTKPRLMDSDGSEFDPDTGICVDPSLDLWREMIMGDGKRRPMISDEGVK